MLNARYCFRIDIVDKLLFERWQNVATEWV